MPATEAQGFFNEFTFDTLLAVISCITGVIALFVGGTAHKKIKNSFREKKKFEDDSQDNSQHAARDIINNNGISDTQLQIYSKALSDLSNNNFTNALEQVHHTFQKQTEENMKKIIYEAERIIKESRLQIGKYDKIDWINIYFESAKNSSDPYMQNVWAKVLAREIAEPGSFSYKTLDVLKNMSRHEFELFSQLAIIESQAALFIRDNFEFFGIDWTMLQQLQEFGLISLDESARTIIVGATQDGYHLIGSSHVIKIHSKNKHDITLEIPCYLLTTAAKELLPIISVKCSDSTAICIAKKVIQADKKQECVFSLHYINYILPGGRFHYSNTDLLKTSINQQAV